jgi:hypothetical protein
MDATLAGKVDVLRATKNSRPRDPDLLAETYNYWGRNGSSWQTCVRDASWHPTAPMIAGKHPTSAYLCMSFTNIDTQLHRGMAGAPHKAPAQCIAGMMVSKRMKLSPRLVDG